MALWNHIRRSGIQRLIISCQNPSLLYAPARTFAGLIRGKTKQIEEKSGPRMNGDITAAYVRLVTEEGHGVIPRQEAFARAQKMNLDLVEVQGTANPPVCKLMDFHKEKFKQEVKKKDREKSKATIRNGECKEVRFSAKTELKDLKMKADTITRMLERGYRVKCTVVRSTKEEDEDLVGPLIRILPLIEEIAVLEAGPHVVGIKLAHIIVRHVKFNTKKKKAINALDAIRRGQSVLHDESKAAMNTNQEQISDQSESEVLSDKASHDFQKSRFKAASDSKLDLLPQKSSPSRPSSPSVSSQSEPSVVEINRYAKQSEPKRIHESDTRVQFDQKQRQFNNSSNPSSPSAEYGRFNSTKPPGSFNQNKVGAPPVGRVNDFNKPSQSPGPSFHQKPGVRPTWNPSSSTPSFGRFSANDPRNSGPNTGDGAKKPSPAPIFFSASKNVSSNDKRNSGEVPADQTRNPSSPTQSYGMFSSKKPAGSDARSSINTTTTTGGDSSSSSKKSYGIFSK